MIETQVQWLTDAEQTAWRAYLRGSRRLEVALGEDLEAVGLSLAEYELISMLSEAPGQAMRMSALADLIVQSRSRVTHTAARLERRGLVERTTCESDGRGVLLVLTEEGRTAVGRAAQVHVESVRRHLVSPLTPYQFQALGEAMQIVRDGLQD